VDDAQRSALRRGALMALVRQHRPEHLGSAGGDVVDVTFGAAVACGDRAFALVEADPERALGPALLWAERAGAAHVELWARAGASDLARRAAYFDDPPAVWAVSGRDLVAVEPGERRPSPDVPPEARRFAALLHEAGVTVVDDHGVLVGEYAGLEVARVLAVGGEAWLEVGVGQADREYDEAFHGATSSVQRIRRVVDVVRQHRYPGAGHHPLNRLGLERWLRAHLLDHPELVGARSLAPQAPLRPRLGLNHSLPAPAVGTDAEGRAVVAVASVGVDLDLVPEAADLRDRHDPAARLVIVVPPRDRVGPVERLVARVAGDVEVRGVTPPWVAT
jgi:hypothetical protein